MTINEYQQRAMATLNPKLTERDVLINSVMGLCGESGEAIDIGQKYLAEAATALGMPLEDILRANLEKLERRYPDGFSTERSVGREADDR